TLDVQLLSFWGHIIVSHTNCLSTMAKAIPAHFADACRCDRMDIEAFEYRTTSRSSFCHCSPIALGAYIAPNEGEMKGKDFRAQGEGTPYARSIITVLTVS
ncbi:MAG: hypothetical protein Q4C12_01710, partial [Clostridia bacterium]|nr:hypothetical protein [Clostridia bacterium]